MTTFAERAGDRAFLNAAMRGDAKTVRSLLEKGADVHVTDNLGFSSMHEASGNGHCKVIKVLLEFKADIHAMTNTHETPLHWAANNNRTDVIKLLVENNADINLADDDGNTPFHSASLKGHVESMELLIKLGADINSIDVNGRSSFHKVATKGHVAAARLLIEHNVNMDVTDKEGTTAEQIAMARGKAGVVDVIRRSDVIKEEASHKRKTSIGPLGRLSRRMSAGGPGQSRRMSASLMGGSITSSLRRRSLQKGSAEKGDPGTYPENAEQPYYSAYADHPGYKETTSSGFCVIL